MNSPKKQQHIGELASFWKHCGDFNKITSTKLLELPERLKNDINPRGKSYTLKTIADRLFTFRGFLRWMVDEGYLEIANKYIKGCKLSKHDLAILHHKKVDDVILINQEELLKLIDAGITARDKAYIALLFDCGARNIEIATLNAEDIRYKTA